MASHSTSWSSCGNASVPGCTEDAIAPVALAGAAVSVSGERQP